MFSPLNTSFSIELVLRSSVLNIVTKWRVFNDDDKITKFLTNEGTFKEVVIEAEEHERSL
jgi:hypothetical protein